MSLLKGILYGIAAQIATFLQLQGQIKIEWFKNHASKEAYHQACPALKQRLWG